MALPLREKGGGLMASNCFFSYVFYTVLALSELLGPCLKGYFRDSDFGL